MSKDSANQLTGHCSTLPKMYLLVREERERERERERGGREGEREREKERSSHSRSAIVFTLHVGQVPHTPDQTL